MKTVQTVGAILAVLAIIVGAAWSVFAKSWEHSDTVVHLSELSKEFKVDQLERQQTNVQQRIWFLEDRLEEKPGDRDTRRKLREAEEERFRLQQKLENMKKEEK